MGKCLETVPPTRTVPNLQSVPWVSLSRFVTRHSSDMLKTKANDCPFQVLAICNVCSLGLLKQTLHFYGRN